MSPRPLPGLLLAIGALLTGCAGTAERAARAGEWPAYGRAAGAMRHSPLTQIDRDLATYSGSTLATKAAFEATSVMVDGVLYLSTPTNRVIALDAATGKERWLYDPELGTSLATT